MFPYIFDHNNIYIYIHSKYMIKLLYNRCSLSLYLSLYIYIIYIYIIDIK